MRVLFLHQSEANPVFENNEAKYSDVFTCREEVWGLLCDALKREYGISMEFAKKVARNTRMGAYTRNRMEMEKVERTLEQPVAESLGEWFFLQDFSCVAKS